jgi:hypothetical protein
MELYLLYHIYIHGMLIRHWDNFTLTFILRIVNVNKITKITSFDENDYTVRV